MFFDWMVLCGTKNGSSMASLWGTFEAPLFLRVYPNKGLRRQNIPSVEKPHTHTPIETFNNMFQLGNYCHFDFFFNLTVKFEWCGGDQWVYIIFIFLNIFYIYYICIYIVHKYVWIKIQYQLKKIYIFFMFSYTWKLKKLNEASSWCRFLSVLSTLDRAWK